MSVFQADCPRCGTKSVAFTVCYERTWSRNQPFRWDTFAICGCCGRGVVATFATRNAILPPSELLKESPDTLSLIEIAPELPKHRCAATHS